MNIAPLWQYRRQKCGGGDEAVKSEDFRRRRRRQRLMLRLDDDDAAANVIRIHGVSVWCSQQTRLSIRSSALRAESCMRRLHKRTKSEWTTLLYRLQGGSTSHRRNITTSYLKTANETGFYRVKFEAMFGIEYSLRDLTCYLGRVLETAISVK